MNDSRSSGSTGWAGGHFYPPEHKEPPQDQGQGQDQDQDQGQEQGQDQGHGHQEGTAYSNGADLGRVDHRHPTPPHPDGDHGLLLIAVSNVVGEPHFERPRQLSPLPPPPQGPQLSPLTLPQHDGTSPSDPLHDPLGGVSPSNISLTITTGDGDRDGDRDRDIIALRGDDDEKSKLPINNNTTTISTTTTTEGKTTTADVSNGGNKMSVMNVSSALSIAEVAIRKSEMLQLQGRMCLIVLFDCFVYLLFICFLFVYLSIYVRVIVCLSICPLTYPTIVFSLSSKGTSLWPCWRCNLPCPVCKTWV